MNAFDSSEFLRAHDGAAEQFRAGRLCSLWDVMINYQVSGVCHLLSILETEESFRERLAAIGLPPTNPLALGLLGDEAKKFYISEADKHRFSGMISYATYLADQLELQGAHDRIELFSGKLRFNMSHQDCLAELRALREAFQSGLQSVCFYHYPNAKAQLLKRVNGDWAPVIAKFADMEKDIIAAIDCYALDHHAASVFHLMMIMEKAVHAFGKKLKVDLVKKHAGRRVSELAWEQILNELNPKLKLLPQNTVAKKRHHEKIIQSYLYAVKDAWRNPTMHPREQGYTPLQNLDLINHVRMFMTGFAEIV